MNGRGIARTFLRAGYQVQVLSSVLNMSSRGRIKVDENDELLQKGAKITYLPALPTLHQRCRDFSRMFYEVKGFEPDVLIGTGKSWRLALMGLALPRKVKKIFYEGMSGESNGALDPRWPIRWFFDEVVCQSPRVAQNFERSFHWRKKLAAIPAFPEPLELTAKLPEVKRHAVPLGMARAALFSRLVEGKQAL